MKIIRNPKYIAFRQLNADGETESVISSISCELNGVTVSVPLDPDNTDFAEIQKQVAAGTLTIADAD